MNFKNGARGFGHPGYMKTFRIYNRLNLNQWQQPNSLKHDCDTSLHIISAQRNVP
jgi:hypothetical protein